MCIAIVNVSGTISDQSIKNSWTNNYHGAGFCYSQGDRFYVYKNSSNVDNFIKHYKRHREKSPKTPFLLHFRISTHGVKTKENLHPFIVNGNVALIHNGQVHMDSHEKNDDRSDTNYLCQELLSKLPDGWHTNEGVHLLMKQMGGKSKFAMLGLEGDFAIVNEDAGLWLDDNWYSNDSFKEVKNYYDFGGTKVYKSTGVNNYYITINEELKISAALISAGFLSLKDSKYLHNLYLHHQVLGLTLSDVDDIFSIYNEYFGFDSPPIKLGEIYKENDVSAITLKRDNGGIVTVLRVNNTSTMLPFNINTERLLYKLLKAMSSPEQSNSKAFADFILNDTDLGDCIEHLNELRHFKGRRLITI